MTERDRLRYLAKQAPMYIAREPNGEYGVAAKTLPVLYARLGKLSARARIMRIRPNGEIDPVSEGLLEALATQPNQQHPGETGGEHG